MTDSPFARMAQALEYSFDIVCRRYPEYSVSLLIATIYYYPSLIEGSLNAGYLYTGDFLNHYWPLVQKLQYLYSRFHFIAVDFSLFNGSGDFGLAANSFAVSPFFIAYGVLSSLFPAPGAEGVARAMVLIIYINSFIACAFSIKLARSYLGLTIYPAVFSAVIFAFGLNMIYAHGQPGFLFSVAPMPWIVYAALKFNDSRTLTNLVIGVLPVMLSILGGYIPIGVACIFLSTALILFILALDIRGVKELDRLLRTIVWSFVPMAIGCLLTAPYLVAAYFHLKTTQAAVYPSLFYSAHQLSESPLAIMRLLSDKLQLKLKFFEVSAFWGLILCYLFIVFLLAPQASRGLTKKDWKILKFAGGAYALTLLAVFGPYSPVSSLVYYFVPQVGGMHIYQRFLTPAGLLLGICFAFILGRVVRIGATPMLRRFAVGWVVATMLVAFWMINWPQSTEKFGINPQFLFELILSALFGICLLVPGEKFKYSVAVFLVCLPSLNLMYQFSQKGNRHEDRLLAQPNILNRKLQRDAASFMEKAAPSKAMIKYVDLTPMWNPAGAAYFPASLPYMILAGADVTSKFSSYWGFTFYLSPPADYIRRMPVNKDGQQDPDWEWVKQTGADFVVTRDSDMESLRLAGLIDEPRSDNTFNMESGIKIIQLTGDRNNDSLFDNGYFKIHLKNERHAVNIARNAAARQSSTAGGALATLATDGNTDGLFSHGSVTHTLADPNAWLELDLGSIKEFDEIKIWGRTDCCGERLKNFWVLVSDKSMPANDNAETLMSRPGVKSRFVIKASPSASVPMPNTRGRYIRVQLDGKASPTNAYLSLAEVEVLKAEQRSMAGSSSDFKILDFSTDDARSFDLSFSNSTAVTVSYLLWPNQRFKYVIDGQQVAPRLLNGLATFDVGPGTHRITIAYNNYYLTLFWVLLFIYFFFLAAVVLMKLIRYDVVADRGRIRFIHRSRRIAAWES